MKSAMKFKPAAINGLSSLIKPAASSDKAFRNTVPPDLIASTAGPLEAKKRLNTFFILAKNTLTPPFGSCCISLKSCVNAPTIPFASFLNFLGSNKSLKPPNNFFTPGKKFTNALPTLIPALYITLRDFRMFRMSCLKTFDLLMPFENPFEKASKKPLKLEDPPLKVFLIESDSSFMASA